MASVVSNVEFESVPADSSRKKRRKISGDESPTIQSPKTTKIRWKSESEHRIYSSKLAEALRQSRRVSPLGSAAAAAGAVRDAADRVLAAAAKGTTRWSRAILASRHRSLRNRLRLRKVKRAAATGTGKSRSPRPEAVKRKLPAVQRKVRALSRLVPGCRKIPLPNLLDETTDYIAALQMQIRAMTALAELLAGEPLNRTGPTVEESSSS